MRSTPSLVRSACRSTRNRARTARRSQTGLGKRLHHVQALDHRAGPAVGENQREAAGARRAGVEEADAEPVDRRAVLADGGEPGLYTAPVIATRPVGAERLQIRQRDALLGVGLRVGPAG